MARVAHKRTSYDERTGRDSRSARISAKAVVAKPVFNEDDHGHLIREWTLTETRSFTQEDIASVLKYSRALEVEDMLEFIPLSAIKNAIYRGWIVKAEGASWFLVTRLAKLELDLPKKDRMGRTIKFFDNGNQRGPSLIAEVDRILKPLLPAVSFTAPKAAE